MKRMIRFFEQRMLSSGLARSDSLLLAARDDKVFRNQTNDQLQSVFSPLLKNGWAAGLIFARPAQPYATIIDYLSEATQDAIYPRDCETRTFFHRFPIAPKLSADSLEKALKKGKGAIIPKVGIVTLGSMTLEQAYVNFSSICFACFVKFFSDYLTAARQNCLSDTFRRAMAETLPHITQYPKQAPSLLPAEFASEEMIYKAIEQAGKTTVELGLVDSFFGNVSFHSENTLYISQTGASLDYLAGCIDPCKLDRTSCAGITASSEFSAHRAIYALTDASVILHGHPKFSVILSMVCEKSNCPHRDECHIRCPEKRAVNGIPIVPGEVGTGEFGLCNTVPAALKNARGAIVHGHGVFTTAKTDFNDALQSLLDIERMCQKECLSRIEAC